MAQITIGDVTGTAEIDVDDPSFAAKSDLKKLVTGTSVFVKDLGKPLDTVNFQSATFTASFAAPAIGIDAQRTLTITAGANTVLTRYSTDDGPLLGTSSAVPEIDIAKGEYWMSFEVDGTLDVSAGQAFGSGFGVSVDTKSVVKLTSYTKFDGSAAGYPNLGAAIGKTISGFSLLSSASDVRRQQPGTVTVSDVTGTVKVSGSYSYPLSVNQLSLAESLVPFRIDIAPEATLALGGSVALTGEYVVQSWRTGDNQAILALLRKKGTTLKATFTAAAGLGATAGNTELIQTFFNAVAPGIDLASSGLHKDDPRYSAINDVLTDSISRTLEISLNAAGAATFSNQAAFVYAIDLTGDAAATDAAIHAAIAGDWSLLGTLPNAKELKNVVGTSAGTKLSLAVNLLGLFSYETIEEFVLSATVLRNHEDGSVTITDKATATRIAVASTPWLADPDKLRSVLYEATIATATYAAASGKFTVAFQIKQSLLLYSARTNAATVRKDLRLAVAVGKISEAQLRALAFPNPSPRHVLIDASQSIPGAQAANMFFADTTAMTPRDLNALLAIGRKTLAQLLDPADPVDARRIEILNSDAVWAQMDNQKFPRDSPASYSDWFDVTFWAGAVHDIAGPLKVVIQALQQLAPGVDPSADASFTAKRKALSSALGEVTKDTHAAFENGWPIAVTYVLAGGGTGASVSASWDGVQHLPIAAPESFASNALAKKMASRAAAKMLTHSA